MPTIFNLTHYRKCPDSLKVRILCVLEHATRLVRHKYPGSMSDNNRTKIFAKPLNTHLGKPNSCNKFEYIDIVLSHNTVLPFHLDEKNDHRDGYDHCTVYTFASNVSGRVCRVSLIMTSRLTVGAWLENCLLANK